MRFWGQLYWKPVWKITSWGLIAALCLCLLSSHCFFSSPDFSHFLKLSPHPKLQWPSALRVPRLSLWWRMLCQSQEARPFLSLTWLLGSPSTPPHPSAVSSVWPSCVKRGRETEVSLCSAHPISGPAPKCRPSALGLVKPPIRSLCFLLIPLSTYFCFTTGWRLNMSRPPALQAHPVWLPDTCPTSSCTYLVQGLVLLLCQGRHILRDFLAMPQPSRHLEVDSLCIVKHNKKVSWLLFSVMTVLPFGLASGGILPLGPSLIPQLPCIWEHLTT